MRVMSAGDGYRDLLASVAAGDGQRDPSTPLTRYYAQAGCPPGFWLGSGLRSLGDGRLRAGGVVSESQLALLLGAGRDPVSGEPLGHADPSYRSCEERIRDRICEHELIAGASNAVARRHHARYPGGMRRAEIDLDLCPFAVVVEPVRKVRVGVREDGFMVGTIIRVQRLDDVAG